MKKLLCLLALLCALMGLLVVDLIKGDPGAVELAEHMDTTSKPTTSPRRSRSSSSAELQRVIRQGSE